MVGQEEITVVIPNYNGISFLQDCLQSLFSQGPGTPKFGVLVVDNGSEDGSLDFLRDTFPNVQVKALPENTGFCHAVNLGIQMAETPYVILLNNDTKVKPGFVAGLYGAITGREDLFSVSAKMLMWDREDLLDDAGDRYCALGWAYGRGKGKPAGRYESPAEVFSACGGAAIYRKSVFDRIGLFDEQHFAYLEDLDIGWRARIYGYRNAYEPSAEVVHYGSASTGSRYNEKKTLLAAANNVYVAGKNMPLVQLLWNLPLLLAGYLIKFLFFSGKGMGGTYLRGLWQGVKKLCSPRGRASRVPFRWRHLKNYFAIQLELYVNLIRILKKN